MYRSWSFEALEFVVLWEQQGREMLPAPFIYTSDTPLLMDFEREKFAIRQKLRASPDRSFEGVLDVIAEPDIRMTVYSCDEREPENPEHHIVLHAARRDDKAYLVKQKMGKTRWHSAGFTVTECDVVGMADAVAAELPDTPMGKLAETTLIETGSKSDDVDYSYGRTAWEDSFDDTVEQRSKAFLTAPMAASGVMEIIQGRSRFGPRGITSRRLHWRDVTDDGRYVIGPQQPPTAIPTDRKRFTAIINTQIADIVTAIKDERR